MDVTVIVEMATSIHVAFDEILERDIKQGKFWFRIHINECRNVDELYLHLLDHGLVDFQARKACADLGEHTNNKGEKLADVFGFQEGQVMSFLLSASTEDEFEEKMCLFSEGVRNMKETVENYLLHQTPDWVQKGKSLII